jgi:molybdate transport system substrate-binding protein
VGFEVAGALTATFLLLSACGEAPRGVPSGREAPHVRVFAAASLGPFLEDASTSLAAETGILLVATGGATSTLARQIEAGAPADVFVAAEPSWMDRLEEAHRLVPGTRREVARGALVLVAPAGRPFQFEFGGPMALADAFEGRLAIGDPEHVPVGRYARQALERAGAWDGVRNRLVGAGDARAALALVERGDCAAGIVYASDARSSSRVKIVCEVPSELHDPVSYTAALVLDGNEATGHGFLEWLQGQAARDLLSRHEFAVAESAAPGGTP